MSESTTSSAGLNDTAAVPSSGTPRQEGGGGVASIGQPDANQQEEQSIGHGDFEMGNAQVVIILCGLIASGKRCNQDDLGDRRRVEQMARDSLSQGLSVCIDRTNFNQSQRFHWIKIAREFPETSIWVIVFDTPYEVCAARLQERTGHPTITSPEQGLSVLSRFSKDFEPPEPQEGYDRILYLKPGDHLSAEYTHADVSAILKRVKESSPVTATLSSVHVPPSWIRGRGYYVGGERGSGRPYRGRGAWTGPNGHNHNPRDGGPGHNYGTGTGISTAFRGWGASPSRGANNRGWASTGRGSHNTPRRDIPSQSGENGLSGRPPTASSENEWRR